MDNKITYCYIRESSQKQIKYGHNIVDQRNRCVEFCNYKKYENYIVLSEEGKSAKTVNRPKMNFMIEQIKLNHVERVVIYCLDRLTRSLKDLIELVELFEKYDVELVSLSENIETKSPIGLFTIQLLGSLAELERNQISSRTIRGMTQAAKLGRYIGHTPYGYFRRDKKIYVDPETISVVKDIFSKMSDESMTVAKIVEEYNDSNVCNRRWSAKIIDSIIRNRAYIGEMEFQGCIYKNAEAVVSKEIWDKCNANLERHTKKEKHNYIYTTVYCSDCNKKMKRCSGTSKSGRMYLYYKCLCCKNTINVNKILPMIKKELLEKLSDTYSKKMNLLNLQLKCDESNEILLARKKFITVRYKNSQLDENTKLKSIADEFIEKVSISFKTKKAFITFKKQKE